MYGFSFLLQGPYTSEHSVLTDGAQNQRHVSLTETLGLPESPCNVLALCIKSTKWSSYCLVIVTLAKKCAGH